MTRGTHVFVSSEAREQALASEPAPSTHELQGCGDLGLGN